MILQSTGFSPVENKVSPPSRFGYKLASMRARLAVFALFLTAFACATSAYVLEGPRWAPGSVVVLQLSLGSPGSPLQDGSTTWNQAVAPAIDMWNENVANIRISAVMDSGVPASRGDRMNSVVFSNTVYGQSFGGSTLAVTMYQWSGNYMTESDTLFNVSMKFDSYRGPLQFVAHGPAIPDIRRVFLHELGHGLGLGHPDSSGQKVAAVMNSIVSDQAVVTGDDVGGIQSLYGAPVSTPAPTPTPAPTATPPSSAGSRLANISTRMRVGTNDNVLIGGFIISGTEPKTVIVRALGPSLTGISGTLADPYLELHDSAGNGIASNDDWQSGTQVNELNASGVAPKNPNDAAMIVTLSPGSYTAIVSGYANGTGVALVEVYEYDSNATRLMNISTRGFVGVGDQALIGGLIVQGTATKNVIIRALGPSLSSSTSGALADPVLELRDSTGNLLSSNDNYTSSPQYAQIVATGVPPKDSREAAVIAALAPGNYTAIVRGANNATGVGMVEVFDLQ